MGTELAVQRPAQLEAFDPFEVSVDSLIVIAFPKSNSKNFPFALSLAQAASRYSLILFGGKDMHVAVFAKTETDAGKVVALLSYTSTWKGSLIFSRGRMLQSGYHVMQVIECFLKSCACNDSKAYCHRVIDDPFSPVSQNLSMHLTISLSQRPPMKESVKIARYTFPCKYLQPYFHFQRDHPSLPEDQIQAAGVQHGCHACPNFDATQFKNVGFRTAERDIFD